jgi:energy-coupling factor transport system ATP-binding protein
VTGTRTPDPPVGEEELVAFLTAEVGTPALAGTEVGEAETEIDVVGSGVAPGEGAAVEVRGAFLTYNSGTFLQRSALREVDVSIRQGAVTAVVGSTASGKSTLLQIVAGLLRPDRGAVRFFGANRPTPGDVGMVFQRPETQLFKSTVWEDVAVAPRLHGLADAALERRVDAALSAVELDPGEFGGRPPYALSLGEQRRVALAGVMSLDPRLLVLDEPGAGLDPVGRERLMSRLGTWARSSEDRTLVFSSHDIDEVAAHADRVIVLDGGMVLSQGPADLILGDASLMEAAGLRPPLVSRVAVRLGGRTAAGIVRVEGLIEMLRPDGVEDVDSAEDSAEGGAT